MIALSHVRVSSCRNRRAVGYHGLESRSSSQRQSGIKVTIIQTGCPSAPARWAMLVSTEMMRSKCSYERRRVGVIAKRAGEMVNALALIEDRRIGETNIFLQADKCRVDIQKREKSAQAD